jgi:hypothetical protein
MSESRSINGPKAEVIWLKGRHGGRAALAAQPVSALPAPAGAWRTSAIGPPSLA